MSWSAMPTTDTPPAGDRGLLTHLARVVYPALETGGAFPDQQAALAALLNTILNRMAEARRLPPVPFFLADVPPHPPLTLPDADWKAAALTLPGRLYAMLLAGRHAAGSYYTPDVIAGQVAARVLEPDMPAASSPPAVCDPAMGGGAFLLAAAESLAARLSTSLPPNEARWQALQKLYGLDSDPAAVILARAALWMWLGDPDRDSQATLEHHLYTADALLDDLPAGFPS
ncbi:MAG: N-6 DNA methylase, partial [Anaerolineae bacterium]|nr:N-6 DNA methylase [Anaerolineae bacterium]